MTGSDTPTDSEEIVFACSVRGYASDVYHTDRDCRQLQNAYSVRAVPHHLVADRRVCQYCESGNPGGCPPGTDTNQLRRRLLATDPDTVGGDGR